LEHDARSSHTMPQSRLINYGTKFILATKELLQPLNAEGGFQ